MGIENFKSGSRLFGFFYPSYPGSRIQGSKRNRIPDPQHWLAACASCSRDVLKH